jgi:hypothetical protein
MKTKQFLIFFILTSLNINTISAQEYVAIAQVKGKAGFLDNSGDWFIDPVYDEVKGFAFGLAAVRSNGKWGYINTKNEMVISPRFDRAESFSNAMFTQVESNQLTYFIGRTGQLLSSPDTGMVVFNEDMAILNINGRYGYISMDNTWIIEPQYEMAWPFRQGYAKVKKNGKWIYINKQGEEVVHVESTRSYLDTDHDQELSKKPFNGKWGFVQKDDEWSIFPQFDYVKPFSEGLAPVKIENKWGYVDINGKINLPAIYEESFIFSNGLASVKMKGKFGIINKEGDLIVKAKYDNPLYFYLLKEFEGNDTGSRSISELVSLISIDVPEVEETNKLLFNPTDKRLALIIGNGTYNMGGSLANPGNDALAMSNSLERLGFEVKMYLNSDLLTMKQAIDDFGDELKEYDIGLFFYAGHGIQVDGYNYLVPVDASIESEGEVEYNCVDAGRLLSKMEESGSMTNIIILDACRDNPFERSWTRKAKGQGLAFMNAPAGSLVAYATAPGHTASDGTEGNGLYTSSLLKHIQTPGISILEVLQMVRSEVRQKSSNQQTPWESTSLEGNFFFIE